MDEVKRFLSHPFWLPLGVFFNSAAIVLLALWIASK